METNRELLTQMLGPRPDLDAFVGVVTGFDSNAVFQALQPLVRQHLTAALTPTLLRFCVARQQERIAIDAEVKQTLAANRLARQTRATETQKAKDFERAQRQLQKEARAAAAAEPKVRPPKVKITFQPKRAAGPRRVAPPERTSPNYPVVPRTPRRQRHARRYRDQQRWTAQRAARRRRQEGLEP